MIEAVEALLARSGFGTAGRSRSIEVLLELKYAGQGSTLSLHVPTRGCMRMRSPPCRVISTRASAPVRLPFPREPKRCVAIKVVGRGLAERRACPSRPETASFRRREKARRSGLFRPRARLARHPDRPRGRT
jgi:hypothetical protein